MSDAVKKRSKKSKLRDFLIIVLVTLILGEIGIRFFVTLPPVFYDEKVSCYRYDTAFGWFPKENTTSTYNGSVNVAVVSNSDGFRDVQHHQETTKPSIAFFGDSFVWGYDVTQDERITEVAQNYLPEWEIFNFGVSGYGTDQEYLLLQKFFPKYQPEIVVLVVHSNDSADNSTNIRYHYRKPYYELNDNNLELKGQPVPISFNYQAHQYPTLFKSKLFQGLTVLYNQFTKPARVEVPDITNELIRAFNQYTTDQGSKLLVVFTYEEDESDKAYFNQNEIQFLCAPTDLKFPAYGKHWTAEGHQKVGEKILEKLYHLQWLEDDDFRKDL